MSFHKLIDPIRFAENLDEADLALQVGMAEIGCEKFSYNYYPHNFQQTGQATHMLCTQKVEGWQNHYAVNHYDRIDPIFKQMRGTFLPFGWELETEITKHGKTQQQFFSEAMDFGFRGGFAVPIHAPRGEFANLVVQDVMVLKRLEETPETEYQLQVLAYHFHAKITELLKKEKITDNGLTPRETECLFLTAQHKTAKEIAKILKITSRTVSFHIENAIKKLKVKNKYQAIDVFKP